MKISREAYPACRALLGEKKWQRAVRHCGADAGAFADCLREKASALGLPPFLHELARLERALARSGEAGGDVPGEVAEFTVNPSLQLLSLSWRNLAALLQGGGGPPPEKAEELLMVWRDPSSGSTRVEAPTDLDLLALKVAVEELDIEEAAAQSGRSSGVVDAARHAASRRGVLLAPPPLIRRAAGEWPAARDFDDGHLVSRGFTLQWHITQACDLHCRHCYDRSRRRSIPFEKALGVLDDLVLFCRRRRVSGHVTFTGGNPLLHPRFADLYRGASERGFTMSILGNPASREALEGILSTGKPYTYQVSLEGLEAHNDAIRGEGHFRRVMEFLPLLRELGISSMVMLTLTEENIDQVLPLAGALEGVVDDFYFNRLAAVGEGAALRLPAKARYAAFLEDFLERQEHSPHMGLKDNLFNIILRRRGKPLFGGCTGFGCGAAFNFITLLAEGEAHACRKFPSPLGNVLEEGLEGVYESEAARAYRRGCAACRDCAIRPVCGGCLAVAYGQGLDPLTERDPHCLLSGRT